MARSTAVSPSDILQITSSLLFLRSTALGSVEMFPKVGLLSGLMKVCNVLNLNGSTTFYHPSPRLPLAQLSSLPPASGPAHKPEIDALSLSL